MAKRDIQKNYRLLVTLVIGVTVSTTARLGIRSENTSNQSTGPEIVVYFGAMNAYSRPLRK